nr:putative ribonuclease H-like domain-containing protein [Tanacetum cinerariifolium]
GNPQQELQEKEVIDSRCSRHMTGNISYLSEYKEIDGGYVAFEGDPKGGKITDFKLHLKSHIFTKFTIGGCQFLGKRLILWQCKKQTVVANSTIKAEYVAAASCCRQQLMERLNEENQAKIEEMNQVTHTSEPSRRFNSICYDDDDDDDAEERTIPLRNIISQLPPSIVITTSLTFLPFEDPEDSLIMGNEDLNTIPEKESDEFIKSIVEDLVLIPSESEDTSGSDSECVLPSCDDFSPINIFEEKFVTFSNPLFNSNDDFTSSDDESLSYEDVTKDNVKIYSKPLFEFDDEYISSDVNPLFDEVLENIESKDSYDSNLDEPDLLVTLFSDANEDECFDPRGDFDEIDAFLDIDTFTNVKDGYHDSEGDTIYLESLLTNETIHSLPSEVFLDHDTKILKDESVIDDSKNMVKIFDPDIPKKFFSPTYVSLPFTDRHYLFFTYVV